MKKIYWKTFIAILSFKKMFDLNLGDIVIYMNKEYRLTNGKRLGNLKGTYWNMQPLSNNERTEPISQYELKKKISLSNYVGSFKTMHRFYMTNWFDIWCNSGILPWMKACRIW